jgi:hypothetical protein
LDWVFGVVVEVVEWVRVAEIKMRHSGFWPLLIANSGARRWPCHVTLLGGGGD